MCKRSGLLRRRVRWGDRDREKNALGVVNTECGSSWFGEYKSCLCLGRIKAMQRAAGFCLFFLGGRLAAMANVSAM